jgi:citrate lyase subunit beta/citryl-CoA lyase
MLPKVETSEELRAAIRSISEAERRAKIPPGQIRVLATIETALGLVHVEEIAFCDFQRVLTLVFGGVDFTADLRIDMTRSAEELLYARSRIVIAARAASLASPIDGAFVDLHNADDLLTDSRLSRQLGFQGRVAIHPSQISVIREAYRSSPEEIAHAERVVSAFESALLNGTASVQVDGRLVDYPVYQHAQRKLSSHSLPATRRFDQP